MRYGQARAGRIFVVRLEDGDILHASLERLATEEGIMCASVAVVGGADRGSRLVVGPARGRAGRIEPVETVLDGVHEITGTGTIFPDAEGKPVLHLHAACGRNGRSVTGCVRNGVKIWHVCEAVVRELVACTARRLPDAATGFELLDPGA